MNFIDYTFKDIKDKSRKTEREKIKGYFLKKER